MFDSDRELGHLLHRISRLSKQLISKNLAQTGLTGPQARVLLYLWRCPDGPVHQRDIEDTFSLSAPTVNGILQRLLEKGLITRETSERDARYNCIALTDAGRSLHDAIRREHERLEHVLTAGIDEAQCEKLRAMLLRVTKNLEDEAGAAFGHYTERLKNARGHGRPGGFSRPDGDGGFDGPYGRGGGFTHRHDGGETGFEPGCGRRGDFPRRSGPDGEDSSGRFGPRFPEDADGGPDGKKTR